MVAIAVKELSKSYGRIHALSKVSFDIEPGEVIGLLGPNGAGKTTLMKILTGYLEPDAGAVEIHGIDLLRHPEDAQRRIGYLPEHAPLYGEMLVQEYLDMMAAMRGVAPEDREDRVIEAVRATGLVDRVVQPIGTLSKGYKQRVGIAQAIIHKPDVLILDEPTNGLDPAQIVEIRELIKRLAHKTTVFLSTHILSEVEATCERIIVIMQGTLRENASLEHLRSSNTAVIGIVPGATEVEKTLRDVDGVTKVEALENRDDKLHRFRVTATQGTDLCVSLYETVRATSWKLGELRPESKTLEGVFKELADKEIHS
ncbi:MAG TPA: ATP-binding cassette domain-containing protein [Kofleriaceae bacterium]|jgi:ABC-2 type transport system ATP-binding protein